MEIQQAQGQYGQRSKLQIAEGGPLGNAGIQADLREPQQEKTQPRELSGSYQSDFIKQIMQMLMTFMRLLMQLLGGQQSGQQDTGDQPQGVKKGQQHGVSDQFGQMPIQTGEEEAT